VLVLLEWDTRMASWDGGEYDRMVGRFQLPLRAAGDGAVRAETAAPGAHLAAAPGLPRRGGWEVEKDVAKLMEGREREEEAHRHRILGRPAMGKKRRNLKLGPIEREWGGYGLVEACKAVAGLFIGSARRFPWKYRWTRRFFELRQWRLACVVAGRRAWLHRSR
jgi:hypothetical protein